jgi:hypothetical protein
MVWVKAESRRTKAESRKRTTDHGLRDHSQIKSGNSKVESRFATAELERPKLKAENRK